MTIVSIETIAMKLLRHWNRHSKNKSGFCFNAPSVHLQNWTLNLQSFSLNSYTRLL